MDEIEETMKTHFANACQEYKFLVPPPGYFHPYRKPKHPNTTSGHLTTTTIGVFMPSPVVHPTCRTTQDLAGSVRLGLDRRSEWRMSWLEGRGQMLPRDPWVGLGWTRGWIGDWCWCREEVCYGFFLSVGVYEGVVILPSGSFERYGVFSLHSGNCTSFVSSIPCHRRFSFILRLECDANEYFISYSSH